MGATLESLNAKFGIAGALKIIRGEGGLPCIDITLEACTGRVYFHGAHVTNWKPAGHDPVIFLSQKSLFTADKAIRGGVPVCWPWFGPHAKETTFPMHGFARIMPWELESAEQGEAGQITVVMLLKSSDATKKYWPYDFELRHHISFSERLTMKLETQNLDESSITLEEALHTYFAVGDARMVEITGCDGAEYMDKANGRKTKKQEGDVVIRAETDRIYIDPQKENMLKDEVLERRISIRKSESRNTVIWNPWVEKSKALADFGDDEWHNMVCVETCNVNPTPITIAGGASHQMGVVIGVRK